MVQHVGANKPSKALQAKRRLKEVLTLIELINEAPPIGLPDLMIPENPNIERVTAAWAAQIARLGPRIQRFIGPVSLSISERYHQLQSATKAIRRLAASSTNDTRRGTDVASGWLTIGVSPDGKIVGTAGLLECFRDVDAHRIRQCHCGRIFWAKRRDQSCCGGPCANSRRVANWRQRYQEEYKQQRYERSEGLYRGVNGQVKKSLVSGPKLRNR